MLKRVAARCSARRNHTRQTNVGSNDMRQLAALLTAIFLLSLVATACGSGGSAAPSTPGQYSVQKDSVHFDGDRYQLYWADSGGALHHMDTRNLRLVQDPNSTFLEVPPSGDPVLHLRQDEPITVDGQDRQGSFGSPWFPFLLGAAVGNAFGGGRGGQTIVINNPAPGESRNYDPSTPTYRYPPTGSFGRDDELHGSLDTSKAQPPDYAKVQPAPNATTGKAAGTGGGTAASNKTIGSGSTSTGAANATSAQSGGTGGGTASSSKGGFANGSQSYTSRSGSGSGSTGVGAGSRGALPGTSGGATTGKPSTSVGGGSKGIGGARAPSAGRH
jgi:hypothetical protein